MGEQILEKVRIVVDEGTLKLTSLGQVSGVIYVQMSERSFPSQGWHDLCASILSMWLFSMNRYLLGLDETATLYFMDGDYALKLIHQSNQQTIVRFMEPNDVCCMESEIDIPYFAKQMLAASVKIVNHFPQHRDIRNIREIAERADALRDTLRTINARETM